jgi:hypothetical protein
VEVEAWEAGVVKFLGVWGGEFEGLWGDIGRRDGGLRGGGLSCDGSGVGRGRWLWSREMIAGGPSTRGPLGADRGASMGWKGWSNGGCDEGNGRRGS